MLEQVIRTRGWFEVCICAVYFNRKYFIFSQHVYMCTISTFVYTYVYTFIYVQILKSICIMCDFFMA